MAADGKAQAPDMEALTGTLREIGVFIYCVSRQRWCVWRFMAVSLRAVGHDLADYDLRAALIHAGKDVNAAGV